MSSHKTYTIYPLRILERTFKLDIQKFRASTTIHNIIGNKIDVKWSNENIPYSIITDKPYWEDENGNILNNETKAESILFGRFLRLRKGPISQLDVQKFQEEVVTNTPSKFLVESAHFVLDTANNIMLAEYNTDSVNILSNRVSEIFKRVLDLINAAKSFQHILPIPSDELIKNIINKESSINGYILKLGDINLDYLEKNLGIGSEKIKALLDAYNMDLTINIIFKYGPKITKGRYDSLKKLFKSDRNAKSLKVKTEEGNFDIIKDNLLYYQVNVDISDDMNDQTYLDLQRDIQKKMLNQLMNNRDAILNVIDHNKTLDDF